MNSYRRFLLFLKYFEFGDNEECWEWQGGRKGKVNEEYGYFTWPEKQIRYAHMASYEFFIGPRNGLCVCHSCDNPPCVNPNHLWLGTQRDNNLDCNEKHRRGYTGHPKISYKEAEVIRNLYATGKYTQREVGSKFGVSYALVSLVVNKQLWEKGV